MNLISLICLCIYVVVSFAYVIFYAFGFNKVRIVLKFFLVPLLFTSLIIAKPNFIALLIGLGFDYIGDICLIPKKKTKIVKIGNLSFFLGHICYLVEFLLFVYSKTSYSLVNNHFLWLTLSFVLITGVTSSVMFIKFKMNVPLGIFGAFYFAVMLFWIVALTIIASLYSLLAIIAILGSISYILSDGCIVTHDVLKKKFKYRNLFVSSTYVIAIGLITLSIILI